MTTAASFQELRILTGKSWANARILALFNRPWHHARVKSRAHRTGPHTMMKYRGRSAIWRRADAVELSTAPAQVAADFQVALGVVSGSSSILVWVLAGDASRYGDMRRRARQSHHLRVQKQELEREVDDGTRN